MNSKINKTYYLEDLFVGQEASISKIIYEKDIDVFAEITGDLNPLHIDSKFAKNSIFKKKNSTWLFNCKLNLKCNRDEVAGSRQYILKSKFEIFSTSLYRGENNNSRPCKRNY